MKHLISVDQIDKQKLNDLCILATIHKDLETGYFNPGDIPKGLVNFPFGWTSHNGKWVPKSTFTKTLTALFYETSSRTYASFISAMLRVGGNYIPVQDAEHFSSVAKGETLEDTIRTMECYSDVIVLRHKENGAAERAMNAATTASIINAGDGTNEHPTQALLDFFTILMERGWTFYNGKTIDEVLDGLTITMMGDLILGRTVKSFSKLLRNYNVKINWVSPEALRIPKEYLCPGDTELDDVQEIIHQTDVLYVVRTQFERFANAGFKITKTNYSITKENMAAAKPDMILMHPLPRNEELPTWLDTDKRSAYFRQMKYGLHMREAVLQTLLENNHGNSC